MSLFFNTTAANRKTRKPLPRPRKARLDVEALESRLVPTINVNSTLDILNPTGVVTLRSAIQQANTQAGDHTIDITVPGTYQITLRGNATDNTAGEFAYTGTGNLNIVNTSGGRVVIDGGGLNRVFDINPAAQNATPFTVTFTGLTITDGNASPGDSSGGSGGGIRAQGAASVVLNNDVLANNTATADGGAIALESANNDSVGTLTVNASQITGNHAGDAGGGIETDGTGLITINQGTIISHNTCVNQGAGVWLDAGGASLVMTDVLVADNTAITMLAGGIGNAGAGNVTLVGCTVENNFAGGTGGGFGDAVNMGTLTVQDCLFLDNTAAQNGGGIQEGGPQTTITASVFVGNVSQGNGNNLSGNGGALFVNNGQMGVNSAVTVTDTLFSENKATNGGAIEDEASSLTITASTFRQNSTLANNGENTPTAGFPGTGGSGGAINVTGPVQTVTIANSLFVANAAVNGSNGLGGAIAQNSGTLTITDSQFTANVASQSGGALWFTGTTLTVTVTGTTFNGNAANFGGAVFFESNGSFTNDTFTGNQAFNGGGAIEFINDAGLVVTLLNDTINANTAGAIGGGIELPVVATASFNIQNTIIAQNTAFQGPDLFTVQAVTDKGGNLIFSTAGSTGFTTAITGQNPQLGPLENNGGQHAGLLGNGQVVQTEALLRTSPAIGMGGLAGAPATDERGFKRPGGGNVNPSIGAYEPQFQAGLSHNQVFVEGLYETLLGRQADAGEAGWIAALNNGLSPSAAVFAFVNTVEYRTLEIENLFQRYLHRQADAGGLQVFVSFLNHGGTVEQAAAALIGSPEYFQLHGGTNAGFVAALYQDGLGRQADQGGQDGFTQALNMGMDRGKVADLVFSSAEYFQDLVSDDFAQYLGRTPDAGGLTGFVQALQGGLKDETVVALILGSGESYGNRS